MRSITTITTPTRVVVQLEQILEVAGEKEGFGAQRGERGLVEDGEGGGERGEGECGGVAELEAGGAGGGDECLGLEVLADGA